MDKNTFRRIMIKSESSFKFLGAPDGFWIGVNDAGVEEMFSFDKMSEKYKKNCIKYLKKYRSSVKHGEFLNGIDTKALKLTKSDIKNLYKFATEAVDEKINQLETSLKMPLY